MATINSKPLIRTVLSEKNPDSNVQLTSCSLLKDFHRIIVLNSVSNGNIMVVIMGPLQVPLYEKSIMCGLCCLCISDRCNLYCNKYIEI